MRESVYVCSMCSSIVFMSMSVCVCVYVCMCHGIACMTHSMPIRRHALLRLGSRHMPVSVWVGGGAAARPRQADCSLSVCLPGCLTVYLPDCQTVRYLQSACWLQGLCGLVYILLYVHLPTSLHTNQPERRSDGRGRGRVRTRTDEDL